MSKSEEIESCGVIPAPADIYALWNIDDSDYFIEKVVAYHYDADSTSAYLKPICQGNSAHLETGAEEQIVLIGTKEECEKKMKELRKE